MLLLPTHRQTDRQIYTQRQRERERERERERHSQRKVAAE